MKYEINIGDDFCDDIVRLKLIQSYHAVEAEHAALKKERKRLRKIGDELPSYRYEDFCHDRKMKKVLFAAIRYYSTPDQWDEFCETIL